METELIDKLFLELSQITKAKTAREIELEKPQNPKVKEALATAIAAIYFDDSSDYRSALFNIVESLDPLAAEVLEESHSKAYNKYVRE